MEWQLYRRRTSVGSFAAATVTRLISSPRTAPVASVEAALVTRSAPSVGNRAPAVLSGGTFPLRATTK
jgi:hypothetical protein